MQEQKIIRPLLKWPGGKAWLAPRLKEILEGELAGSGTYFEPFLGAGAIFFCLQPKRARLTDINSELIRFFRAIRDEPAAVIRRVWQYSNTRECYYRVRGMKPKTPIGEAARFLFLNRTCWGGIFRLNRNGKFNVPFGDSRRMICRLETAIGTASALESADLDCADFETSILDAGRGDVVYADPPYTTLGRGNGFLRYNERLFRWSDQTRLAQSCHVAAERGAFVSVSGLWHEDVLRLFPGWWAWRIERKSLVSRNPRTRRTVFETVLFNRLPKFPVDCLLQMNAKKYRFPSSST